LTILTTAGHKVPHEGLKPDELVRAKSVTEWLIESDVSGGNRRVRNAEDCVRRVSRSKVGLIP
jgi:hypothetical protein